MATKRARVPRGEWYEGGVGQKTRVIRSDGFVGVRNSYTRLYLTPDEARALARLIERQANAIDAETVGMLRQVEPAGHA